LATVVVIALIVAGVGANPSQYHNRGILLNSEGTEELAVRTAGRTAAQHRTDRESRLNHM
jgi:hypothetical protein